MIENDALIIKDAVDAAIAATIKLCINVAENTVLGPNHTRDLIVANLRALAK